MVEDGGRPRVGRKFAELGVRVGKDVFPENGIVRPDGAHGMSVAPALADLGEMLPSRLRSRGFPEARGSDRNRVWAHGDGNFERGMVTAALRLQPTNPSHGVVEPSEVMAIDRYQQELALTRDGWTDAEPPQ